MRVIALEYHDVVRADARDASGFPGRAATSYKLLVADFENHLRAVSEAVTDRPTVHDLRSDGRGEVPVLLTFDDGGASAYTEIADRLEAHGWRGHFFVATDYIGHPAFLSSVQIASLRRRGHVIGSHSCSHPLMMARCSWPQLLREWAESVRMLEDVIGEPITVASVPGGSVSKQVVEAAANAGIRTLFTSRPAMRGDEVAGCTVLGRFTLRSNSSPASAARLASGQLGPRVGQWTLWMTKSIVKRFAGPLYGPLWRRTIDRGTGEAEKPGN